MKRIISAVLTALLTLTLISVLTPVASAITDTPALCAVYGHPTVDGVISDGEYDVKCTYVMDKTTASAWVGDVGDSSVTWYFAWDETGLYYTGTINDTTPTYRDSSTFWVGIDCLEIAINPGHLLTEDDRTEGIFFSFGAQRNGKVIAYRHNFSDGLVSDMITGAAKGHKKGSGNYTIEVMIPWSIIRLKTNCSVAALSDISIDTTGFVPGNGVTLGVLPCAIDADTDDHILAAYKFNGTDFIVRDFLNLTLTGKPDETTAETFADETTAEETTSAETSAVETTAHDDTVLTTDLTTEDATSETAGTQVSTTAPETTSPVTSVDDSVQTTETADKTGCSGSVGILCVLMLIPCAVICRKQDL